MAIAYNSTSLVNETAASSTSLTWSHTCNALDKKLIVAAGGRAAISGITYNGVTMSHIVDRNQDYQYSAVYYLDYPDTSGAHNIVVTYSSSAAYREGLAVGVSGCSTGIGAVGTTDADWSSGGGGVITSNITTVASNSHIFVIPAANYTTETYFTYGAGQTAITKNTADYWSFRFQYKATTTPGANSTTMTRAQNVMIMSFELKLLLPSSGFFAFF